MRDRLASVVALKTNTSSSVQLGQCNGATSLVAENAHVAQSVEHFLGKEEVMGPIPIVGFAKKGGPEGSPQGMN
jgi:hypothetical protein